MSYPVRTKNRFVEILETLQVSIFDALYQLDLILISLFCQSIQCFADCNFDNTWSFDLFEMKYSGLLGMCLTRELLNHQSALQISSHIQIWIDKMSYQVIFMTFSKLCVFL